MIESPASAGLFFCLNILIPVPSPLAVQCTNHHHLMLHTILLPPSYATHHVPYFVPYESVRSCATEHTSYSTHHWLDKDTCNLPVGRAGFSFRTVRKCVKLMQSSVLSQTSHLFQSTGIKENPMKSSTCRGKFPFYYIIPRK